MAAGTAWEAAQLHCGRDSTSRHTVSARIYWPGTALGMALPSTY